MFGFPFRLPAHQIADLSKINSSPPLAGATKQKQRLQVRGRCCPCCPGAPESGCSGAWAPPAGRGAHPQLAASACGEDSRPVRLGGLPHPRREGTEEQEEGIAGQAAYPPPAMTQSGGRRLVPQGPGSAHSPGPQTGGSASSSATGGVAAPSPPASVWRQQHTALSRATARLLAAPQRTGSQREGGRVLSPGLWPEEEEEEEEGEEEDEKKLLSPGLWLEG